MEIKMKVDDIWKEHLRTYLEVSDSLYSKFVHRNRDICTVVHFISFKYDRNILLCVQNLLKAIKLTSTIRQHLISA